MTAAREVARRACASLVAIAGVLACTPAVAADGGCSTAGRTVSLVWLALAAVLVSLLRRHW